MTDKLSDAQVDLWVLGLPAAGAEPARALEALLSTEERVRAERFHLARHRHDYVLAHALMRVALAAYTRDDAAHLKFVTSGHGRPALLDGPAGLDFSLTHTHGLAAVAVTRGAAVGVDAEEVARAAEHRELADHHFAAEEAEALRALPAADQGRRFSELWTLKEAYAKARGAGLSLPLDGTSFTIGSGRRPRVAFVRSAEGDLRRWRFALLPATARHVVAIARSGPLPVCVRVRDFSGDSAARLRAAAEAAGARDEMRDGDRRPFARSAGATRRRRGLP